MAANDDYYRSDSVSLVTNGDTLPEHSALDSVLSNILPSKRRRPTDTDKSNGKLASGASSVDSVVELRASVTSRQPTSDKQTMSDDVFRQMEELDSHRRAVQELTDKILGLNEKRIDLERENADLRRQLDNHMYTAKPSLDLDDPETLDPNELRRRYALVKGKLKRQAGDLKDYKDKVLELQKKLIEKNELEKEYLLTRATDHSRKPVEQLLDRRHDVDRQPQQHQLMRQLKEKTDQFFNLEDLYIKQQRVVDKLDKLVNSTNTKESHQEQRVNEVLREENRLLRMQLETATSQQISDRRNAARSRQTDEEILRLQQQAEVAEERTRSLEKQLDENARRWSRERAELRLRLQEAGFGLNWPSPFPYRLTPLPNLATAAEKDSYIPRDYRTRHGVMTPRTYSKQNRQSYAWQ